MNDRASIVAERVVGLALFLGALVFPWLGLAALVQRLPAKPAVTRGGLIGLGVVAALIASSVGLFFSTCYYPGPPGVGAIPRAGKRRADAVASLLASYRTSKGRYPQTLESLDPGARSDTLVSWFGRVTGWPLTYVTDSGGHGFRLEFHYAGPGSNRCFRTDSAAPWQCSGLF
jgi:hypothetical protein